MPDNETFIHFGNYHIHESSWAGPGGSPGHDLFSLIGSLRNVNSWQEQQNARSIQEALLYVATNFPSTFQNLIATREIALQDQELSPLTRTGIEEVVIFGHNLIDQVQGLQYKPGDPFPETIDISIFDNLK
jgi:hypothetical protein